MDPDANLKEQLELAAAIENGRILTFDELDRTAARLAELVQALDHWLARGGFRPGRWHR